MVTPAQPLLSVVPDDKSLEVEVTVLNRDIGFIREGQAAAVKVDTFPYTRYGHLEGRVRSVSHEAIQDEKLGLVYLAHVILPTSTLMVDDVPVHLLIWDVPGELKIQSSGLQGSQQLAGR